MCNTSRSVSRHNHFALWHRLLTFNIVDLIAVGVEEYGRDEVLCTSNVTFIRDVSSTVYVGDLEGKRDVSGHIEFDFQFWVGVANLSR